jgi:hypothetical protein
MTSATGIQDNQAEEQKANNQRNIPLDILKATAVHRGLDSGLTYGVRRTGLFQNYYANAAREGIEAALSGKDVLPRWRRTLGIINPNLTGLTDYEVARGLTHVLKQRAEEAGLPISDFRSLKTFLKNKQTEVFYNQLNLKKDLSPISRNVRNALNPKLRKNKIVQLLKRYGGKGVDKQINPVWVGAPLAAATGAPHGIAGAAGALFSASPDLLTGAAAKTETGEQTIEALKLGLIGTGSKHKIIHPTKSRILSTGLNLISPSSGEIYDFGKDLTDVQRGIKGLNLDKKQAVKFLDKHLIDPAKQTPNKLKNKAVQRLKNIFKRGEATFTPDYSPVQLKEMGAYHEVYGPKGTPRLASLSKWPSHWYHKEDPWGWLQWYQRYSQGRRIEDDARQIKRWAAFKARHGGKAFRENPTPRRAYALRNWAIDPTKLVDDPGSLQKAMEAYRNKKYLSTEI